MFEVESCDRMKSIEKVSKYFSNIFKKQLPLQIQIINSLNL